MTSTPERRVLLALLAISAALQGWFVLGSDPAALLITWIPDDAFYYLQPAWNAAHGAGFSFDGIEPTYGFQPLWAVLLAGLAAVAPSKASLVTLALLTGAVVHLAAGAMLFAWFARAGASRGGLVAAGLWLLNPDLVRMQTTGMESGLVAALLLATLLLLDPRRRPALLGATLGALFLARVSMLLAGVLAIGALVRRRLGRRKAAWIALGTAAVVVPWLVYADLALGQPLPASTDRKIVAGLAGAARFLADLPGVPDAPIRALLPASEALLFDAPGLIGPTGERIWLFAVRAPVGWALGAWLPGGWGLGAPVLAVGWCALVLGQRGGQPARLPRGLGVLVLLALGNVAANNLLLSQYVEYGYWYRVPEVLTLVVLVGIAAERALTDRRLQRLPVRALLVSLALAGAAQLGMSLAPREHDPASRLVARGGYDVAIALSDALPAGTRVGSWNAGLIGWLADGPVVVNLDGLANRPDFVPIAAQEVLVRHGVADHLALMDWLEEEGIEYLVDLQPDAGLGEPFYGVIPADRWELVLRSSPLDHWTTRERDHAVMLVRFE